MTAIAPPNAPESATRAVLVNRLPEPTGEAQFQRSLAVVIGLDARGVENSRLTTPMNDALCLASPRDAGTLVAAHAK